MRLTPEIIAAMHQLALEQRRELGVRAPWHVGDVTWGLRQHEGREDEWTIRVWRDGDRVVAWSWLKDDRGLLEWDVRRDRLDLLDEILADPEARTAVAFEDDAEVRAALERHGFTDPDQGNVNRQGPLMRFLALDVPEAPELPEGFRCRTVEPGDLAERVAIHRDVWAPSRVTESSFATVQASWPYRASLDCVVEAPDGRFAAYCLLWPDDENRVGELEPVGVRDEFAAAAWAPPSARSRCAAGTRRGAGRRSSTASPTRRVGSTSRSASAATRRWSATRADQSSPQSNSGSGRSPVVSQNESGSSQCSFDSLCCDSLRGGASADALAVDSPSSPCSR